MTEIDHTDARALADQALVLADQDEHVVERAAALMISAAWMLLRGGFDHPKADAAEQFCRERGVCPCSVVLLDDRPVDVREGFGRILDLDQLVPAWAVALGHV